MTKMNNNNQLGQVEWVEKEDEQPEEDIKATVRNSDGQFEDFEFKAQN